MDPLVTIQNLIALACGSHSEEESRTSALAACKAIKRHGVVLSLPCVTEDPFLERLSDTLRRQQQQTKAEAPRPPPPPKKEEPKKDKVYRSGSKMYDRGSDTPRRVVCKYEAFCQGCGVECEVGTSLWWRKGRGVTCMACGPSKLAGKLDVEA
jgi:hypothetical protein